MRRLLGERGVLVRAAAAAAAAAAAVSGAATARADYTASRLIGGLNQPVYVTGAPGTDDLFVVQRAGTNGTVGDIVRYNRSTGTQTSFVNIGGSLVQDGGLLSITFSPDYATNGRFYVTALVGSTNKLFEYQTPAGGGTPTLQRTLLSYDNPRTQHTIDWVGFKPNATGAERNELYVTMGDGGIQADEAGFTNRGQDASLVFGKVLRLDVDPTHADAYPSDPNKNFAIPANNPFAGDATGKLGEVFNTGFRNPWRASFDRQTGDLYVGDVGFNTKEEVDFNKNDAGFNAGRDFGWARREGTIPNPVAAYAGTQGASLNPIYEVNHPTFSSITGGYVYRGPIVALQGKYLFADFNTSKIYALNFDRDADPTTFNGANAGVTNVQDITAFINGLIAANGGGGPISGLVSFGEDNSGNLFLVSIGTGNIFNPALGTGSVYTLAPAPTPDWAASAGGSWNAAADWSPATIPNGPTAVARLAGPAGTGTRLVTLDAATTVQQLTFDNAGVRYEVAGPATLTVNANPQADALVVASGDHAITAPLSLSGSTRVNVAAGSTLTLAGSVAGTGLTSAVVKRGTGTLVMPAATLARYAVDAGTLRLSGTGNARTLAVAVADGATLDLASATLIVDYAANSATPLDALQAAIDDGRLLSSTIGGLHAAIGYLDTSRDPSLTSFNGATSIDATTLIFRATLRGDANLDRAVDFTDLLTVAQNYGGTARLWQQGDSNGDGVVGFADLLALAQNYGQNALTGERGAGYPSLAGAANATPTFLSDWALARSLVPEPASLALAGGTATVLLPRRRRGVRDLRS